MTITEWVGIGSTVAVGAFGYMKFRQAQRVDAVSAQSGVASNHRAGIDQVVKGLNDLVDQLQEAGRDDRLALKDLAERLLITARERDECSREVARLRHLYEPK